MRHHEGSWHLIEAEMDHVCAVLGNMVTTTRHVLSRAVTSTPSRGSGASSRVDNVTSASMAWRRKKGETGVFVFNQ